MLTDSLIVFLVFSFPPLVQAFQHPKRFVHVPSLMTWDEALQYCRANHTDLASFQNKEELYSVGYLCWKNCWIGFHREVNNPNNWIWSDGEEVKFKHWLIGEPNYLFEKCAVTQSIHWVDRQCSEKYESVCYEFGLTLVKEKKTWEEALEHCRTLQNDATSNNDPLFDLPHMHAENANQYAKDMIKDAQTQEVWIGLRYLAGRWFWVNGFPLDEERAEKLPVCPAPMMHCGTMSKMGGRFSVRDCSERRNFFCLLTDKLL